LGHSVRELFASRSRRILISTVVIIAVLFAGVYGYLMSLPPPAGPSVTLTSPPIQLSMTLDKTRYSFSENMTISFYLRNISNETITLVRPSQWPAEPGTLITAAEGVTILPHRNLLTALLHFCLTITDMNGTALLQLGKGGFMATYDIVLEPDASLNQTLFLNTKYDLLLNPNGQQLQPGAYQISAALYAYQGSVLYTRETPSIAFTLVSTG
jgi:hypothetical protein